MQQHGEQIRQRLASLVRPYLSDVGSTDPLPPDVPLVDLGLRSMRAVELVLALEDAFEIRFPEELLDERSFRDFATLAGVIQQLLPHKKSGDDPG